MLGLRPSIPTDMLVFGVVYWNYVTLEDVVSGSIDSRVVPKLLRFMLDSTSELLRERISMAEQLESMRTLKFEVVFVEELKLKTVMGIRGVAPTTYGSLALMRW